MSLCVCYTEHRIASLGDFASPVCVCVCVCVCTGVIFGYDNPGMCLCVSVCVCLYEQIEGGHVCLSTCLRMLLFQGEYVLKCACKSACVDQVSFV